MAKLGTLMYHGSGPTKEDLARFDGVAKRAKGIRNHPGHPVEIVGEPLGPRPLTPGELTEKTYRKHLAALEAEGIARGKRELSLDTYGEPINPANYNTLFGWSDGSMAERIRKNGDDTLGLKGRDKKD